MLDLYRNIKTLREELGLSQDELAKQTGYTSRSSIAKIEKGEVDLPQSKIALFALALHTTPGTLMGLTQADLAPASNSANTPLIMSYYNSLNSAGKKIATEHVRLLTLDSKYTVATKPISITEARASKDLEADAANQNPDATPEQTAFDDDVMDDPDF